VNRTLERAKNHTIWLYLSPDCNDTHRFLCPSMDLDCVHASRRKTQ